MTTAPTKRADRPYDEADLSSHKFWSTTAAEREKIAQDLRSQIIAVDNVRKSIARVLRAPAG